ncbi:S41 family peptidase [Neolewinella antarctica]|uniref:Tricorn protease homolog n=1 Tax=Neolewinella antarctica TaxID=442734 RepID=A0ABX0XEJ3_9BACT|nr:S41 family peptidase [Neolewinella antarctica]NJC27661.1 tricorn protease [Neolewinella antarctica]
MRRHIFLLLLPLLCTCVRAQTTMLHQPTMSEDHVAFTYANDLWVADRDGNNPRRLTIDEGRESNPVFSPDGKTIAFSAQYDGNTDVFTVPVEGGVPERLTWHPDADQAMDWHPTDRKILFGSRRQVTTRAHQQLFLIGNEGGHPEGLGIPTAWNATYSADGRHIAYNPLPEAFKQWKMYRGGRFSRIWIQNLNDNSVVEVPTEGSNDVQPQWVDGKVYFRSDREGEFNLFVFDPENKSVEKLTDFTDFPILDLGVAPIAIGGAMVFEQAGRLHTYDPATKRTETIDIDIKTDLPEVRPRIVSGKDHLRSVALSPNGKRVVADYRGDILTAPTSKGDVRNLTATSGTHESYPEWSPDGKTIAYFSDASGEHQLHLYDVKTNEAREINLNGTGFYAYPHWSPDSKQIAFVDNGRNLYVVDAASGEVTKVDQDDNFFPGAYRDLFGSWSHDSKWLAYAKITNTNFERAFVYEVATGASKPVSDGYSNVTEPIFSRDGKYLYLSASTDAGPAINWFQQSSQDMEVSNSVYLVTLQAETVSPLKRMNDVEVLEEEGESDEVDDDDDDSDDEDKKEEEAPAVQIDFADIEQRIIDLPMSAGSYDNLAATESGLLFISRTDEGSKLMHFSLEEQEAKEVMEADGFMLSSNGSKMLVNADGTWMLGDTGKQAEDKVSLDGLRVKIDPRAEWANIFQEAWRVNRDFFYDPGMHGVDWKAAREKYEPFVAQVPTQDDLYEVMTWMMSELGVGHHRFSGPAPLTDRPDRISGGLLGADLAVENGRYRIKKIFGGLNWNPDLRSPLTEPGVNVEAGEYIIAVDGQNVVGTDNFYRFFEDKASRIVTLTVAPNADGSNSRDVEVTTIDGEYDLRNRDWVEGNLKRVTEATDGRVAYVYVPNTAGAGHQYFKRYFFPQVNRQAIIVDERFNAGGQIADYYVELLSRPYQNSWTYRYGADQQGPLAAIHGPKILLANEMAGSGGDLFPYLWKLYGLGPIVGKRTWGGLVGVLGYPEFIDGGSVTAPNVGFWDKDGYSVENEGVAPDIEVDQLPAMMNEGRDPQLERAITEILKALEENPPVVRERPAFEVRGTGRK